MRNICKRPPNRTGVLRSADTKVDMCNRVDKFCRKVYTRVQEVLLLQSLFDVRVTFLWGLRRVFYANAKKFPKKLYVCAIFKYLCIV